MNKKHLASQKTYRDKGIKRYIIQGGKVSWQRKELYNFLQRRMKEQKTKGKIAIQATNKKQRYLKSESGKTAEER